MHVKAIARARAIGLGHERRDQLVLARHALDDALEQHRIVGRPQGVRGVQQVDLELADAVFRHRGVRRHALLLALQIDVAEELAEILKLVERQDGVRIESLARIGRDRRHRRIRVRIDEVEFELGCNDRLQPEFGVAPHDVRQRLPRIAQKRRPRILKQPQRNHRAGPRRPVDRQRPAPGRDCRCRRCRRRNRPSDCRRYPRPTRPRRRSTAACESRRRQCVVPARSGCVCRA